MNKQFNYLSDTNPYMAKARLDSNLYNPSAKADGNGGQQNRHDE